MKNITKLITILLFSVLFSVSAWAEDTAAALTWPQFVQKKYELTDEQMKTLNDAKLSDNDLVRVAHFAKLSNKSIEEILKLRSETKGNAWGKIAKDLGIDPKEIGQSVATLKKERNDERKKELEKKRKSDQEKREQMKEERKQQRERAREHQENRNNKARGPRK